MANTDELNVKVHCNCDILSHSLPEMYGYDDICVKYPGAVAVETEGAGIFSLRITSGLLLYVLREVVVMQ